MGRLVHNEALPVSRCAPRHGMCRREPNEGRGRGQALRPLHDGHVAPTVGILHDALQPLLVHWLHQPPSGDVPPPAFGHEGHLGQGNPPHGKQLVPWCWCECSRWRRLRNAYMGGSPFGGVGTGVNVGYNPATSFLTSEMEVIIKYYHVNSEARRCPTYWQGK